VNKNLLPNCPIQNRDILNAEDIFGPDIGSLKGKTIRQTPNVVELPTIEIPPFILEHYQNVVIAADIMYVNKIPFFVTISRNIRFAIRYR
jgi:hypothetical protein